MFKNIIVQLALFISLGSQSISYTFDAKVISVHDGDTITVQTDSIRKIRLIGIDAPELKQPYGIESKDYLNKILLGKTIKIETDKKEYDLYGRLLGYVYLDGVLVNSQILKSGNAFYNYIYPNKAKYLELVKSENYAKDNYLGVWNKDKPLTQSPKDFRNLPKVKN
jgi:micrococcal nuclease